MLLMESIKRRCRRGSYHITDRKYFLHNEIGSGDIDRAVWNFNSFGKGKSTDAQIRKACKKLEINPERFGVPKVCQWRIKWIP